MANPKPFAALAAMLLILCSVGFSSAQIDNEAAIAAAMGKAVTQALSAAIVTGADGPADDAGLSAWQSGMPPAPQGVDVTVNGSGVGVSVKGQGGDFRLSVGDGQLRDSLLTSFDGVTGDILNILMPWLHTSTEVVATSGPMMTAVGDARSAVHQAIASQVADKINFAIKQSDLIKETVNKEISDYISSVNTASGLIQNLIKNKGSLLGAAAGKLGQGVGNIRSVVAGIHADAKQAVQDKVENLSGLAGQFSSLSSAMMGDMGSTATLITNAASSKAKAFRDVYTTTEGLVKAHIDATVVKKVDALNSLLDRITAAANAVESSDKTGPVIDWKMSATQTKMQALAGALDRVAAAVKAMPTPSQIHDAKMAIFSSTRVGQAMVDPMGSAETALSQLMGKINQVNSMIKGKIAAAKLG